jgi:mannuronan synthase
MIKSLSSWLSANSDGPQDYQGILPRGWQGFLIYTLCLLALVVSLPSSAVLHENRTGLYALGAIAAWRYIWGLIHLIRSNIYRSIVFPRLRARVTALADDLMPSQVFILVTSFRIEAETSFRSYCLRYSVHDCGVNC